MRRARVAAVATAALVALAITAATASAGAAWRTELLAPAGVLGPAALSFDPLGDGLLLWAGNPYAMQPAAPFDGGEMRLPTGAWSQTHETPFTAIEQLQLYGRGHAMLIGSQPVTAPGAAPPAGPVPCCGAYPGTVLRVRVVYADGSADGAFGTVRVLDGHGSPPQSAANQRGDAIVAWVHGGRLRVAQRSAGGPFAAPVTLPGRVSPGDPLAAALNADGVHALAWIRQGSLYARVRFARRRWGAPQRVLRLPVRARPPALVRLRAAISPSGTVVLAWEAASRCDGCGTLLRAGVARLAPDRRWREFELERSTISPTAPGGAVGDGLAGIAPLIDSSGHVYVAWTGELEGAPIVKLVRLAAGGPGFWTPLSDSLLGAALDAAAAGPDGALLVSWFDESHSTSGLGPVYASLRRGTGRFALAVRLTGEEVTGGSGLVGFQPLSGEALIVSGVIEGGAVALQVSAQAGADP